MKKQVPNHAVVLLLACAALVPLAGCVPFVYVPDMAALERYYSRGVRAENLELLPSPGGRMGKGRAALWESIKLTVDDPAQTVESFSAGDGAITFLHVSDAHVRDVSVCTPTYENDLRTSAEILKFLGKTDAAGAAVRPRLVTKWAALRLAGFVIGASKQRIPYVLHTGDLCDISLLSEVRLGLLALDPHPSEGQASSTTVRTLPGNHDGLFFGNLRLDYTDPDRDRDKVVLSYLKQAWDLCWLRFYRIEPQTHHLGLTKTEFVLAHLLADKDGYGFRVGNSPFVQVPTPLKPPQLASRAARDEKERQLRDFVRGCRLREMENQAAPGTPATTAVWLDPLDEWRSRIGCDLGGRIGAEIPPGTKTQGAELLAAQHYRLKGPRQPGDFDQRALTDCKSEPPSGAYYGFEMTAPGQPDVSVKALALDTRACHYSTRDLASMGDIDDQQLDWLRDQLRQARGAAGGPRPVVIFAHHPPDQQYFQNSPRYRSFRKLLHDNHALIIAYFCGHTHENCNYWLGRPTRLIPDPRSAPETTRPASQDALLVVQTGSTCEYPHQGRPVKIKLGAGQVEVSWRFVDLDVDAQHPHKLLEAALAEARLAADDFPEPTSRSFEEHRYRASLSASRKRWAELCKNPPPMVVPFGGG